MDRGLRQIATTAGRAGLAKATNSAQRDANAAATGGWVIGRRWLAIAAAVLVVGAAAAIYHSAIAPNDATNRDAPGGPTVATVIGARDVRFDSMPLNPGDEVIAQPIRTRGGDMELVLRSGATMKLSGPSDVRLDGPKRVDLRAGWASFHCPPSAKGFAVDLPHGARIVDLGTSFTASVSASGLVWVTVIEGRINVEQAGTSRSMTVGQVLLLGPGGAIDPQTLTVVDVFPDAPPMLDTRGAKASTETGGLRIIGDGVATPGEPLGLPGRDDAYATFDRPAPGAESDGVTAAIRFRADRTAGAAQMLLSEGNASSHDPGWSVFIEHNELRVRLRGVDAQGKECVVMLAHPLAADAWHELAFTFARGRGELRAVLDAASNPSAMDGGEWFSPDGSTASYEDTRLAPAGTPLLIGRRPVNGAPFAGQIGRLIVADRVAAQADLLTLNYIVRTAETPGVRPDARTPSPKETDR